MSDALLNFIGKYLGKYGVGTNPANAGQCVGLIEEWIAAHGKPWIPGNAKDLLANAPALGYKVTRNEPTNHPPAGAIVCWSGRWGGGFGHTALVIAATPMFMAVFEQNNPIGGPCLVATESYSGVEGWLTW